jgi:hypothetical protein
MANWSVDNPGGSPCTKSVTPTLVSKNEEKGMFFNYLHGQNAEKGWFLSPVQCTSLSAFRVGILLPFTSMGVNFECKWPPGGQPWGGHQYFCILTSIGAGCVIPGAALLAALEHRLFVYILLFT